MTLAEKLARAGFDLKILEREAAKAGVDQDTFAALFAEAQAEDAPKPWRMVDRGNGQLTVIDANGTHCLTVLDTDGHYRPAPYCRGYLQALLGAFNGPATAGDV